ncbi:hypothetical protein E2C01_040209 [Portunus trituberculatus]|uniref:Uncharacterized protein n=1 Tax=Portunus trituberculatus TaxID=210409 RepID=A0A5B7FMP8_PORTR|nr:hypothetical protein [Portunus trituberculatus]
MNNDTQRRMNAWVDLGSQAIAASPTDGYSYLKNIFIFQGVNYYYY